MIDYNCEYLYWNGEIFSNGEEPVCTRFRIWSPECEFCPGLICEYKEPKKEER